MRRFICIVLFLIVVSLCACSSKPQEIIIEQPSSNEQNNIPSSNGNELPETNQITEPNKAIEDKTSTKPIGNPVEQKPAHIHKFVDYKIIKEPTCTETGISEGKCGCGEIQTETIAKANHCYGEWTIVIEPTCSVAGEKESLCVCGEKVTDSIPTIPHEYGDWHIMTLASSTNEGTKERICAKCNSTESIGFAKLSVNWWPQKNATDYEPKFDYATIGFDRNILAPLPNATLINADSGAEYHLKTQIGRTEKNCLLVLFNNSLLPSTNYLLKLDDKVLFDDAYYEQTVEISFKTSESLKTK